MAQIFVILHNIRSQYNVGAIFRTADGAGVGKIFLTGYTPAPCDELGRPRKEIHKTALGAEKSVAWEKVKSISALIRQLKKSGILIAAVEQAPQAVLYSKFKPRFPIALIFGNEVRGLDKRVLSKCDVVLQLPMLGRKESLNVAVAAGVVLYSLLEAKSL